MMIVLFHVLYLIGKYVYQSYRAGKEKNANDDAEKRFVISDEDYRRIDPEAPQDYDENKKSVKFFPPAYVQRYVAVSNVLSSAKYHGKLRKVVDFGCSELGFLVYLKNTAGVEEILCVDIDRPCLESYKDKAVPLVSEYLHCRTTPLTIEICEGSVTDRDKKLENTDAVICIELIEHLYPETLKDLPYNIFGYIKPKVAIITTPNADFNVLFPFFHGFRHPDHKFEWSRQEFQDWAENITVRYPEYSVEFEGICNGPKGTEHLGACSQMAIFHRNIEDDIPVRGIEGLYKTVVLHEYPFTVDIRSDEQKILDNATYHIRQLSYRYEEMQEEVPLQRIIGLLESFNITMDLLKTILQEGGWEITDGENGPVAIVPQVSTMSDYTDDNQFWDNDGSSVENDWDDEPGPPIDFSRSIEQGPSEKWGDENWDEEPSIIIPQLHPDIPNNTYLYDGEEISSDYALGNTEDFKPLTSEPSHHSLHDVNIDSQFSDNIQSTDIDDPDGLSEYNVPPELNETTILSNVSFNKKSDDTLETFPCESSHSQAQNDTISSPGPKLKRMLDFRSYMSVSRSSTSPDPFLLQTVKVDKLFGDNSISNQSLSYDQWTLNSTVDQFDTSNDVNTSLEDNKIDLRCIYLNASYIEGKDSDSENNGCTSANTRRSDADQMQDIPKDCDPAMSCTSISSNNISENLPQFTSSPKIGAKINTSGSKRRSLGCGERVNKTIEQQIQAADVRSKTSLEATSETSLRSNSDTSISTASTVSSMFRKWYPDDKNPMYQTDTVTLKGGNDTADKSSDSTLLDSHSSTTLLTVSEEKIEDSESLNSLNSNNNEHVIKGEEEKSSFCSKSTCNTSTQRDTPVQLDELVDKSKIEFTHDDVDRKTESNFRVQEDTSATNVITPKNSLEVSSISNVKSTDTESSCNAKGFSNIKDKSLDLYVCSKDTSVESTSVLCGKEPADYNYKNLEAKSSLEIEDVKPTSPDTPPNSWSPEVMDSGYPNSASAQDMTPEYDLSSIAQDHISDSESPSVEEAPRLGIVEAVEVENADLANNNRDGEGNNMIAVELNDQGLNDLEDLRPLIDVLEDDLENENDIYVLENGFPMWLLRILEMANPGDFEIHVPRDHREFNPEDAAGGDAARYVEQDEGFDSSSSEEDSDMENNEIGNDDNSDINENAMADNIENDNENASNSDSESDQWAAGDT